LNNNLIVITSYPIKGKTHGKETVGIASYTKNTLLAILGSNGKNKPKIIVLAEKLGKRKKETYQEKGIEVRRIWQRNNPLLYLVLMWQILKTKRTNKVLIELEMAMFGSYWLLVFLPLFLLVLKILNKKIIIVCHQVIEDINSMAGHIGIEQGSTQTLILNFFIKLFYKISLNFADKIIVFEQYFKAKLLKLVPAKKIKVIPHGVEKTNGGMTKNHARKALGFGKELVVMYFGFIAWYKGTDWLIGKIKEISANYKPKKIKLIIAGGSNPNHKNKEFYLRFISLVKDQVESLGDLVNLTDFVPENKIDLYFKASDLVILPYRTLMSSSGPLSLALSFGKPFLISQAMGGILKTEDFDKVMKNTNIKARDLLFNFYDNSFDKKISRIIEDKKSINNLQYFSKELAKTRSFWLVGKQYYQEIFNA